MQGFRHPALAAPAVLRPWQDKATALALAGLGFVLPFSTSGVSIFLAVLLALTITAAPALWRSQPWREPTWAVGLLLLAYIGLHCALKDGLTAETRSMIVRYKELLMAPILFALMRAVSRREAFFLGLVAGTVAYALAHWVALFNPRLAWALQLRYISAGFVFAVMAYQLLLHARASAHPGRWRAAAAFCAATALFTLNGRTGQLALLLLMALAVWQQAPRRWRLWALLALPVLAAVVFVASPPVHKRFVETWEGFTQPRTVPETSTEIRMELVRHGLTLARENLLLGGGYAHYSEMHVDAVRRAYANDPMRSKLVEQYWARTENPHDEFVMQVAGGGLPALALFCAWLVFPLLRRRADGSASPELLGLVLAFAFGCLFNSLLMDFTEGHFYSALLAWLMAREAGRPAA